MQFFRYVDAYCQIVTEERFPFEIKIESFYFLLTAPLKYTGLFTLFQCIKENDLTAANNNLRQSSNSLIE